MTRAQVAQLLLDLGLERMRVLDDCEEWRCPWTGIRVIVKGDPRPTVRLRVPDALVEDAQFETVTHARIIHEINDAREAWQAHVKDEYDKQDARPGLGLNNEKDPS